MELEQEHEKFIAEFNKESAQYWQQRAEQAEARVAAEEQMKNTYRDELIDTQHKLVAAREGLEKTKKAFAESLPEKGIPSEEMDIFILYPSFKAVLPIVNATLAQIGGGE